MNGSASLRLVADGTRLVYITISSHGRDNHYITPTSKSLNRDLMHGATSTNRCHVMCLDRSAGHGILPKIASRNSHFIFVLPVYGRNQIRQSLSSAETGTGSPASNRPTEGEDDASPDLR